MLRYFCSLCFDSVCLYQCITKVLESELKPSLEMLFSTEIFSKEWDRNNVLAMAICFVRFKVQDTKGTWSVLCRVMQHMVICWTNQNMCLSCFISNLFCSIFFASLLKLNCTTWGFCFKSTVCVYQARWWAAYHYFNTKCKLVWLGLVYIYCSILIYIILQINWQIGHVTIEAKPYAVQKYKLLKGYFLLFLSMQKLSNGRFQL